MINEKKIFQIYKKKILNQELSLQEFRMRKLKLKSMPSKALIELSKISKGKRQIMSGSIWDKAANELFECAYSVDLRGFGTTRDFNYWQEILDQCQLFPLINWQQIDYFRQPLKQYWDQIFKLNSLINFICVATNEKTFKKIFKQGSFKNVMDNLGYASDALQRNKRGNLALTVVLERKNILELPKFVELANQFNVKDLYIQINENEVGQIQKISRKIKLKRLLNSTLEASLKYKIRLKFVDYLLSEISDSRLARRVETIPVSTPNLRFPLSEEIIKKHSESLVRKVPWLRILNQLNERSKVAIYKRCFKPFHFTHITTGGMIGPCNFMMEPKILPMGSLTAQSFKKIWNNEN